MHGFLALVRKDILIEWRQKHSLFGVLLYAGGAVFMVYMMNGQPEPKVWNALFWLTQIFVAANSIARSFLQEHPNRFRYYYTLAHPAAFIMAKMVYSFALMLVMNVVTLLLFAMLLGWPLTRAAPFIVLSLLGSVSLSSVFTFLSAIAARAQNNASLMAVLGFPIVTPLLMMLAKLAVIAISPVVTEGWNGLLYTIVALDGLVVALAIILFPFLWQE